MKKNILIGFVNSFIILPIATVSLPYGGLTQAGINLINSPEAAIMAKKNVDAEIELKAEKAEAINAYFKSKGMPLEGMGLKMVEEAEKNELDWRLVAAISVRESTGGKHECQRVENNPFGWGSCKIGFESNEHAIETVARNLGGNNPKTAHHYDNKTTIQILHAYNPPSIVPKYAEQVISIMDTIGPADLGLTEELASI